MMVVVLIVLCDNLDSKHKNHIIGGSGSTTMALPSRDMIKRVCPALLRDLWEQLSTTG